MNLFDDFPDSIVERHASLAPLTWFRLGGRADYLIRPTSSAQLAAVLVRCGDADVPLRVLGHGANVLVPDEGVRGVVLRLDAPDFQRIECDGESLVAGGGADMTALVRRCVRAGLAGLEQLAGIPGTVGGGIAMNCGGRYGDISAAVQSVTAVDPHGHVETLPASSLAFSYRQCALGPRIVTDVRFKLRRADPAALQSRFREIWDYKKQTQPAMGALSAGCIFRNPVGESAGRLIDRAGLKGYRLGSAFVSAQHANFAMADRGGCASDVRRLIETIQQRVQQAFGILLEPEVKLW